MYTSSRERRRRALPRWTQKGIVSFETESERSAAHADELCIESSLLLRSRAAAAAEGGGGAFVMAASMSGVSSDARGADVFADVFADAFAGLFAGADAALCAKEVWGCAAAATRGACFAGGRSSGVMLSMAMRSGADASSGPPRAEDEARPSMAMMSAPAPASASGCLAPAGAPGAAPPFMNAGTGSASGAGCLAGASAEC